MINWTCARVNQHNIFFPHTHEAILWGLFEDEVWQEEGDATYSNEYTGQTVKYHHPTVRWLKILLSVGTSWHDGASIWYDPPRRSNSEKRPSGTSVRRHWLCPRVTYMERNTRDRLKVKLFTNRKDLVTLLALSVNYRTQTRIYHFSFFLKLNTVWKTMRKP